MKEIETVHASEMKDKVARRILDLREPNRNAEYAKELAAYKRRLGKKVEVQSSSGFLNPYRVGFFAIVEGKPEFVERPTLADPWMYFHLEYTGGTYGSKARDIGVLTNSLYNRDIRHQRVDEYAAVMRAGMWLDLLTDPLSITDDGQVVNGQHRIAAAAPIDWSEVDNDPLFSVMWGVNPGEAMLADGSRRTHKDEATIWTKMAVAAAKGSSPGSVAGPDVDGS